MNPPLLLKETVQSVLAGLGDRVYLLITYSDSDW